MIYCRTVQLTSHKASQRPDEKLEGKWSIKPTVISVGVTTFLLPSVIVVVLARRSWLMIKSLHSEQTRVTSISCTTQKTNTGMLRIGIKG
jgi:hypothetical protein